MTRVLLAVALAGTLTGGLIGHHLAAWAWARASGEGRRVNVLRYGSTAVPWRPHEQKPVLDAAIRRRLAK